MFDTEEELQASTRRRTLVFLGIIIIIMIVNAGYYGWQQWKPLPQEKECSSQGYEAGIDREGIIICYNDCSTRQISSCKASKVLR